MNKAEVKAMLIDRAIATCMDQNFDDRDRGAYMVGYQDGLEAVLTVLDTVARELTETYLISADDIDRAVVDAAQDQAELEVVVNLDGTVHITPVEEP